MFGPHAGCRSPCRLHCHRLRQLRELHRQFEATGHAVILWEGVLAMTGSVAWGVWDGVESAMGFRFGGGASPSAAADGYGRPHSISRIVYLSFSAHTTTVTPSPSSSL